MVSNPAQVIADKHIGQGSWVDRNIKSSVDLFLFSEKNLFNVEISPWKIGFFISLERYR